MKRQNSSNQADKAVDKYNFARVKELESQNKKLQSQVNELLKQRILLNKSLSFRVGCFLTYPFRYIFNLITGKKKQLDNPIKASIDTALYDIGMLEVTGWALSNTKIQSVIIYDGDRELIKTHLGLFRDDIVSAFPRNSFNQFCGFNQRLKCKMSNSFITIKIMDSDENSVVLQKALLPAVNQMTLNSQYKLFLEYQKQPKFVSINYSPLISIIVPVYNVDSVWLEMCIKSVTSQIYENWQLCLYDDFSTNSATIECLKKWQKADSRIDIAFGKNNLGISLASNQAIKMACGEFIALLDHDDELTPNALLQMVNELNKDSSLDFIYSDEDKIDENGELCDPHFKSDFNLDTLLSHNYICHFALIRKTLGDKVGWFRERYEGSQDHDLFLRVVSRTDKIQHIPKVLYHWRKIEGSTAIATSNKRYSEVSGLKAVNSFLNSQKIEAIAKIGIFPNSYQIKYTIDHSELVSIIIPFRNQLDFLRCCVESVLLKTKYKNYELLLINNQSDDVEVLEYCASLTKHHDYIELYDFNEEFNFSKINNFAVSKANGDVVLFLNNDTEIINDEWLGEMVSHIQRPNIAVVGAKLLYSDNTIQHSGIIVSSVGAVHVNKGEPNGDDGYFQRANYVQNVSACTAACLLVKKEVFNEVGGFDEELFAIAYNDVDLCLKIRQLGYLITYTPYAKLYHYESKSRGLDNKPEKIARFTQELKNYQQKWGEVYKKGDPYYNPNLKQTSEKICLNID